VEETREGRRSPRSGALFTFARHGLVPFREVAEDVGARARERREKRVEVRVARGEALGPRALVERLPERGRQRMREGESERRV
jgi:hypothetical protein